MRMLPNRCSRFHNSRLFLAAAVLLTVSIAISPAQVKKTDPPPPRANSPLLPPDSAKTAPPDSSKKARPDSVMHFDLRRWAGSMMLSADTTRTITATELEWQAPTSLAEIVGNIQGVYMTDPASIGQYARPYVRGVDWRGTVVMLDGIPMNDPANGALNLSMIPAGMVDRIETAIGTRSFLYGTGATGAAINIIRPRLSRISPTTRIRYEESSYNYASSDGSFVQDVSQRVNVAAGYQYQGTDGRFLNSGHEQWNFRGDVRYHPAKDWDVTVHYLYTQTQTGLNEGIDMTETSPAFAFSTTQATVRNPDAYEKLTRHDLSVQLSGTLTEDSTASSSVSAYTTHILREYRDEENRSATNGINGRSPNGLYLSEDHRITRTGLQIRQRIPFGFQTFTAGLFLDAQKVVASTTMGSPATTVMAASLLDEIALGKKSVFSVYGRLDHAYNRAHWGLGSDVRVFLGRVLTFTAGFSTSARPFSFSELYWTGKNVYRDRKVVREQEKHNIGEAGLEFTFGSVGTVTVAYSYRQISNRLVISGYNTGPQPEISLTIDPDVTMHGLDLGLAMRLAWFSIEGSAGIVHWENRSSAYLDEPPRGYAHGGLYYRNRILNDKLELQAGVRGQVRGTYNGTTVTGENLFFMNNYSLPLGIASSIDLVLIGHIGDAYIHVIWENVTGAEYFSTPFTPALDRRFRFGVSWEFLN
jgi:hypothetical protein